MNDSRPGYINYHSIVNTFKHTKLDPSFITVELWNNKELAYNYVGEILFDNIGLTGFIYDENYYGPPLDPAGLDYRKHGKNFVSGRFNGELKQFFFNLLPGIYGNKLLQSNDRRWLNLTDAQRLGVLSKIHASFDAVRLDAHLGQYDQQIVGIPELDKIVQKIVAYSSDELITILDSENTGALTNLKGARGKADYIHTDGKRFVAKPSLYNDKWNIVRMEHAMGNLEKIAGIDSVKSKVLMLPSGNEVLMSLRYDQGNGLKVDNSSDENPNKYLMQKQYNRIAMKSLLIQDPDMGQRNIAQATYQDIKRAVTKYSDKPIKDTEELYKRSLFHITMNNVDNNLGNFEMYLNEDDHWRLAPSYDVLPHQDRKQEFSVAITDTITHASAIDMSIHLIDKLSLEFEIDEFRGRELAIPVMSTIANSKDILLDAGVNEYECELLNLDKAITSAQGVIDELSTYINIDNMGKKSSIQTPNKPNSLKL